MRTYETLFIVNSNISDNEIEEVLSSVRSYIESNGNVLKVDPWGRRRLAYEIGGHTEGYYVLMVFQSEPDFISQLQNYFKISEENVIRNMVVKFEGNLDRVISSSEEE